MKKHIKHLFLLPMLLAASGLILAGPLTAQTFMTLYSFTAANTNGVNSDKVLPNTLVVSGHTLYGTAFEGGSWGNGGVFVLSTDGASFKTLHSLSLRSTGGTNSDGANPVSLLLSGNIPNGNLYCMTAFGGTNGGYGTACKITTHGVLTGLHFI